MQEYAENSFESPIDFREFLIDINNKDAKRSFKGSDSSLYKSGKNLNESYGHDRYDPNFN